MAQSRYNLTYIVLCVIAILAMFSTQLINPLLAIYAKQIGAVGLWIGLSVSAYWVARVLLEIPSGFISTKFGYYLPMAVGLLLTAVGNILCAYVVDPFQLFLARVIMGIGAPLFFAVSMTLIINMFSVERRGSAMGLFQGIEFLGSTLASTFSGLIITGLGFVGAFFLSTAMAVIGLFLLMLPHLRKDIKTQPTSTSIRLSTLPKVLTNKWLLIVCAVTLMNFMLYQGVLFTTFPLYLNEILKMSLTDIGFVQGARSAGYVLSMLFMGIISDRIGRKPIILFGALGTAVMSVVLNYAVGFTAIAVAMFLIGITTGAVWIICPVIAAELVDHDQRGAAVGTYRTFFDAGSVFGPILMIWVVGAYGNSMSFFFSAILLLVVFVPCFWLKETRKALA
jgi:MFS family permease